MTARSIWIGIVAAGALASIAHSALAYVPAAFAAKWGASGSAPGQFDSPQGLVFDPGGILYVCDAGNSRIQTFTSGGAFLGQFPASGENIACDGTHLVVADGPGNRIRRYTLAGVLTDQWGTYGQNPGQLDSPAGIAIAGGEVYVCDAHNSRIQVFSSTGVFQRQWSANLTDTRIPVGVVIGSTGNLFVLSVHATNSGGEIAEYTSAGSLVEHWAVGGPPNGLAINAADELMVLDWWTARVTVFDSDGNPLGHFGGRGTGDGQFSSPLGIATRGADVFVSDATLDRVQRFNPFASSFYPSLLETEWTQTGPFVSLRLSYENPSTQMVSQPLSGTMFPKPYGGYLPEFPVPVGQFSVPPLPPGAHFDVFAEVPFDQLPPTAPLVLAGGGPAPGPCAPPVWAGGIDLVWNEGQVSAQSEWQSGEVLVGPGSGYSFVRVITGCTPTDDFTWRFVGDCPGFTATLFNQDRITPAPPHLPPGWNGWIAVTADPGLLPGTQCCIGLLLLCDNNPSRIGVCARVCDWSTVSVPPGAGGDGTRITGITPNPAAGATTIRFSLARESHVRLEVLDLAGRSVATLWDGVLPEGSHQQEWDAARARAGTPAAGVYFVRLRAGSEVARSKVFLAR